MPLHRRSRGGLFSRASRNTSNAHYETNFGVSSAFGAGNTKIGCLKARRWRAFKQPIFIMRTAAVIPKHKTKAQNSIAILCFYSFRHLC